ncbi:MAG: ferredoxin, partial [Candidatus Glassbacteria bacterium GWA2_58_10]
MEKTIKFKLNGKTVSPTVDGARTLLWVLRTELGLTGTKYGCGEGYCGACTVLVDNEASRSCQLAIQDVEGREVLTIEGLSANGKLHPLQQAFIDHDALQCGYCTPGMLLAAHSLLLRIPQPSRQEIIAGLEDN